jgi:hypothetical protein
MRHSISLDTRVVASTQQVSCDLHGEAVILEMKRGTYYGLNEVGARVWQSLREPRSVREARDLILSEYQVEPGECERDVLRLVQELADEGLVEIVDGRIS